MNFDENNPFLDETEEARQQSDQQFEDLLAQQEKKLGLVEAPSISQNEQTILTDTVQEPKEDLTAAPTADLGGERTKESPIDYIRRKYNISAPDKTEELAKLQRKTDVLQSLSDIDKAAAQLGSYKTVLAKKMGYDVPEYKGGGLAKLAEREKQKFVERGQLEDQQRKQMVEDLSMGKTMMDLEKTINDEQELQKTEGPVYEMTKQMYKKITGADLPEGTSPSVLFKVQPFFKELLKEQMSNAFAAEQNRLTRENAIKLRQMEIDSEIAKQQAKGPIRSEEQKELAKKEAEKLAETKGVNETLQILDALTQTKQILGKRDPVTGKKSEKASDRVSGGIIGLLPNFARRLVSSPSSQVESDIAGVLALPNLKSIFGGNPTEGERTTLLQTLFDGVQDESEILRRVESLEKRMLAAAKENDNKKEHIRKYGTLDKYNLVVPEGLSKITQDLAREFGVKIKPSSGTIVVVKGKRYRVGQDGDTLEEIK